MRIRKLTPNQKKNLRKWIRALRSGKFRQGTHALLTVDSEIKNYCCLGVACEVLDPKGWKGVIHRRQEGTPNKRICGMLGIGDDEVDELVDLNDKHSQDFKQIAEYIESDILKARS